MIKVQTESSAGRSKPASGRQGCRNDTKMVQCKKKYIFEVGGSGPVIGQRVKARSGGVMGAVGLRLEARRGRLRAGYSQGWSRGKNGSIDLSLALTS